MPPKKEMNGGIAFDYNVREKKANIISISTSHNTDASYIEDVIINRVLVLDIQINNNSFASSVAKTKEELIQQLIDKAVLVIGLRPEIPKFVYKISDIKFETTYIISPDDKNKLLLSVTGMLMKKRSTS